MISFAFDQMHAHTDQILNSGHVPIQMLHLILECIMILKFSITLSKNAATSKFNFQTFRRS